MPFKDPAVRQAYNKKYQKEYYRKNYDSERKRFRERKEWLREWVNEWKMEHGCSKCGSKELEQLEFFYTMPCLSMSVSRPKHTTITRMVSNGNSQIVIEEAMKDFTLLCRGCRYGYTEIYKGMGIYPTDPTCI